MTAPNSSVIAAAGPLRPPIRLFSALKVVLALAGLILLQSLLDLPGNRPMVFIMAGAAAILAGSCRSSRDLLYAGLLGAAAAAWYLFRGGTAISTWEDWFALAAVTLGLGSLAVLSVRALAMPDQEGALYALKSSAVLPVFALMASMAMELCINVPAKTFDVYLYKFDAQLGFQASFWCGSLLQRFPSLGRFEFLTYDALGVMPAVVFAIGLRMKRRLPFNPLTAFVWAGIAAFCLYQICPGTAPFVAFKGAFPWHPPPASSLPLEPIAVPGSWRNAMPSMHMTWALMAFSASMVLPFWVRWFTGVFVVLTFLATLGTGQHYLIDLIVACPFTAAMSAACANLPLWTPARLQAFAIGGSLTLAWLVLLRLGWMTAVPSAAAWAAVVATVAGAGVLQARLLRTYQIAAGYQRQTV